MFEQTFIEETPGTKKPLSILASLALQLCLLCILVGIPLLYTQGLPGRLLKGLSVAPPVPHAAVPESAQLRRPAKYAPRLLNIHQLTFRSVMSTQTQPPSQPADAPSLGVPGGDAGGNDLTIPGVIGSPAEATAPPPAAAEPKKIVNSGVLKVGGRTEEANLVHKVIPPYPPLAKSARVQGAVEFTALISKDGNIENLQLVRGHPLLVQAAKEAVLKWKYRPTLLNGAPVEVVTDITVNFNLSE